MTVPDIMGVFGFCLACISFWYTWNRTKRLEVRQKRLDVIEAMQHLALVSLDIRKLEDEFDMKKFTISMEHYVAEMRLRDRAKEENWQADRFFEDKSLLDQESESGRITAEEEYKYKRTTLEVTCKALTDKIKALESA
jgi:hypothetical protein